MTFVKNQYGYYTTLVTKDLQKEAQDVCNKSNFNHALKNSITKGSNNVTSKMGEICVQKFLSVEDSKSNHSYDILYNGAEIEVKTKLRAFNARPDYVGEVALTSQHQLNDKKNRILCFVNYNRDNHLLEILGFISSPRFLKEATFHNSGDEIIVKGYFFKVKAACWRIQISKLTPPEKFIEVMKDKANEEVIR